MASSTPATVDELGIQGCLYLWALLTGQEHRLPVAQTRRMTLVVMAHLQERGVIEVPWPEARWELHLDAKTTPIEGLQWRLAWTVYEPTRLIDALDDYFDSLVQDDFTTAARLRPTDAPALLSIGPDGKEELVNYRQAGNLYIVDLVMDKGVLVSGTGRKQQRVTFTRTGG